MSEVTLHGKPINVGDRIWSFTCGYVVVTGLSPSATYPIITTSGSYNMDGSLYDGEPSRVFWQPIAQEAIEAAKVRPEPEYEWQWLIKKNDGTFCVSAFRTYETSVSGYETYAGDGTNAIWYSRIEESRREVKK